MCGTNIIGILVEDILDDNDEENKADSITERQKSNVSKMF